MRIAVAQFSAFGRDVARNTAAARDHAREAKARDASILLLPEMWNVGYELPTPEEAQSAGFRRFAADARHAFLAEMSAVAAEIGIAVLATFLGAAGDGLTNAAALLDAGGVCRLEYAKVHLADFAGEAPLRAGTGFRVCGLGLPDGTRVRIGVMICYDRVFPEAARTLVSGGAELILVPNASPLCRHRLGQVATRAFENQTAVALANYPDPPWLGRSVAFNGIAYDDRGDEADQCVFTAGTDPCLGLAEVDIGELRAYRARQRWGPRHRRPSAYRSLT